MKVQNGMPHFGARYAATHLADAERFAEGKIRQGIEAKVVTDLSGIAIVTNEGHLKHLDAFKHMAGELDGPNTDFLRTSKAKQFFASYSNEAVDTFVRGFMGNDPAHLSKE